MASILGGRVQDQNLNMNHNDFSAGSKTNVSKAPRKGGLGGRKPLGDLSNSLKPSLNQTSKKPTSRIVPITKKETGSSQIPLDASKKKSTSKALGKGQTAGRKALSDISNSGKPRPMEALKKSSNAKLSILPEEPIHTSAIAEEGFLHDHEQCIKAQTRAKDIDEFLQTIGLDNDFSKKMAIPFAAATPASSTMMSPPRHLQLEEMTEHLIDDTRKLDSPPPCRTPMSPKHYMDWKDDGCCINFKLIETPQVAKALILSPVNARSAR